MLNRRNLLKGMLLGGAAYWFGSRLMVGRQVLAFDDGGLLPDAIAKFVTPMAVPSAMPGSFSAYKDSYKIAVRQIDQQILPNIAGSADPTEMHPATTVWCYGSVRTQHEAATTFSYPGFTIEADVGKKVEVEWRNELVDRHGNYLPHLLTVDPTLHWANPPGGATLRDTRPTFVSVPPPYTGPVPFVTHVHGAHVAEDSDGYPEAWYLPLARNIPAGYARTGTYFDIYNVRHDNHWNPKGGGATFEYSNDQRATTLWYHDHTLGMTRLNVYAGPVGFYLLRGGPDDKVRDSRTGHEARLPGPRPEVGDDQAGEYGEMPVVIQDKAFKQDGSLFFPDSRAFFGDISDETRFIGDNSGPTPGDVSPYWNPEFFGDTIVVNGRTWPYLVVKRKRYRFRVLNASNSRFLVLKLTGSPRQTNTEFNEADADVKFWQIGSDGGFLPKPVKLDYLLMGPSERADVIIDFDKFKDGDRLYLVNDGPDVPFGGLSFDPNDLVPPDPNDPASEPNYLISDATSTGLVMEFRIESGQVHDHSTPPQFLDLPSIAPIGPTKRVRHLTLNELVSDQGDFPIMAKLGTVVDPQLPPMIDDAPNEAFTTPMGWDEQDDPVSENPDVGDVEEWRLYNLTADAHPIHVHLVQFKVRGRRKFDGSPSLVVNPADPESANANGVEPWEHGFKDTVISYPGEVTILKAKFDLRGRFVWHCHILDHEDNEMMRPYLVGPEPPAPPKPPHKHPKGRVFKHRHPRRRWWKRRK
jgi:bilirubin oxidase